MSAARRNWVGLAIWAATGSMAALVFARPDASLSGKYALTWYAVALVLLAVVARKTSFSASALIALTLAIGLFIGLRGAVSVASREDPSAWPYVVAGTAVVGLVIYQSVTRRLDPVILVASVLGVGLVAYWTYNAISGVGLNPNSYPPETVGSPLRAELPLLALALASVGLGITRGGGSTRQRLGLVRPAWWQFFLALLVAYALIGLDGFANYLSYWLTPGGYQAVGAVLDKTDGGGIAVGLVYVALAAVAEEMLFRGAIQPRAGLVATALLFAMMHVQYGVTPILAWVFAAGLAFGALRRFFSTTTAIVAHALTGLLALLGVSVFTSLGFWITCAIVVVPYWRWLRSPEGNTDEKGQAQSGGETVLSVVTDSETGQS